jgi:putative PIG3 family NAD(P)H quinone oxidoreductase
MLAYIAQDGCVVRATYEKPSFSAEEILIKTAAIGVNRADLFQVQGKYKQPPGVTDILGLEYAGEVVACGKKIDAQKWLGAKVMGIVAGGAYAEYVVATPQTVLLIPENISFAEAASLPEAMITTWLTVIERGELIAGERFFMHGGTSGIGVIALQVAKLFGASCFATAGTAEKILFLQEEMKIPAFNYNKNFHAELLQATNSEGVDCILDMVGAAKISEHISLLRRGGRLSIIALLGGAKADSVSLSSVLMKQLKIVGTTVRSQSETVRRRAFAAVEKEFMPWVSQGKIRPVIARIYPFSEANSAIAAMEEGGHIGKIVLQC